jgi:hypothetical protein
MDIHRIALKIAPEKNIRVLRLSVRDPSVGAFPETAGESTFSLLSEGLLRESAAVSVLSAARGLSSLVSAALSSRVCFAAPKPADVFVPEPLFPLAAFPGSAPDLPPEAPEPAAL